MHAMNKIHTYTQCMPCDKYDVRAIHPDKSAFKPVNRQFTAEQLAKAEGYLKARNCEGYNIYARPLTYRYVLIDDLSQQNLDSLCEDYPPALSMMTSPDNYQAWVALPDVAGELSREKIRAIARYLAERYDGDPGSAEPDHLGRLPGFTNRKPKYQQPNGMFPFVKVIHDTGTSLSNDQYQQLLAASADYETTPASFPQSASSAVHVGDSNDRSARDWAIACKMRDSGKSLEDIERALLKISDKAQERPEYARLTAQSAFNRQ